MGIGNRSVNNLGLRNLTRSITREAVTPSLRNTPMPSVNSTEFEQIFPNNYSLDSLLSAEGEYEELTADILRDIMELDFSVLPFENNFPFEDFLRRNTVFSTSPLPGMLFREPADIFGMLRKLTIMDTTLRNPYDPEETFRKLKKFSPREIEQIFGDVKTFNHELAEEVDLNQLYAEALGERWRNGGDISLEEIKEFRKNWESLFNLETDWKGDGTIVRVSELLAYLDRIGDVIVEANGTTPENTIINLDLAKKYFNENLIKKGDADVFADYLEHWGRKLQIKKKEIAAAHANGGAFGQISRAGGTYEPYTQSVKIYLIPLIYEAVVNNTDFENNPSASDTPDSAQLGESLKDERIRNIAMMHITRTLLHEYAHHVSMSKDRKKTGVAFEDWNDQYASMGRDELPSDYTTAAPSEGYAEVFAYYWIDRIFSTEDFPEMYEKLRRFIGA